MPDSLYDRDILSWSEQQAALLRRLARGERVNAAVDWDNLIDEVETVGRTELRACEGLLYQALLHLLKLRFGLDPQPKAHWANETETFLDGAQRAFTPSMRHRVMLQTEYARARRKCLRVLNPETQISQACPYNLDDLLDPDADLDRLLSKLD